VRESISIVERFSTSNIQIVSDIDFTISRPQDTQSPFFAKCLTSDAKQCPIAQQSGDFPCHHGRCTPTSDHDFHLSMSCPLRDAFSEEFYTWLATLDFKNDHPIAHSLDFIQKHPTPPIFLTNRDEKCRPGTVSFFQKHAITHKALHMRPHGDYRPLWDFKIETMAMLRQSHSHILWIDDQKPPTSFENVSWLHPDSFLTI
jgi:hypothetical protein